jgi:hypothetical protein
MNALTNTAGLSLCMAVWLAHDDYTNGSEEFEDQDVISATGLLKSTRATILAARVPSSQSTSDVTDRIASRLGHAVHDSIETTWRDHYAGAMKNLGLPQKMIDKITINPVNPGPDAIPVYLEQRHFREINVDGHKIIVSGKFDQVINGELNDTKTTSVWAYLNGSKVQDYSIQGSIYRWINPGIVTSDVMRIQHVFTDWQRSMVKSNPDYPQHRVKEFCVELMSEAETAAWITRKIRELLANQGLDEPAIIRCTDKELWMSETVYKYYSDPAKAAEGGRATKNFPNYPAAAAHRQKQGKGVVVTIPGEAKACGYCPAAPVCSQRLEYGDK